MSGCRASSSSPSVCGCLPGLRCAGRRAGLRRVSCTRIATTPARSPSGALAGEPFQDRHLLGVWPTARAGHLEDERFLGEARLVEQRLEAFLADLAVADV